MAKSSSKNAVFSAEDVTVVKKEVSFKGYFQLDTYTLQHPTYNGGKTEAFSREIFERGHASAMLPYDPVLDRILLIEQFRPGAFAAGYNPWLLEIPAGIIEQGQSPLSVAKRETFEETGCHAKRIEFICDYLVTPGGSTESLHLYCVEIDSTEAPKTAGLTHEDEDIKVINLTASEAFEWLEQGMIHNVSAMVALYWFKLNKKNIQNKWCS